jgi:O-antigen/teichoic acid export membrane protein
MIFKIQNNLTKLFFEQILKSGLTKFGSIAVSLLNVPLVLNYLDTEKFGIWATITTIVNWIAVLDIGMGSGLRNKLGESIAKNELGLGKTYVSNTYFFMGIIFLSFLGIFLIINPFLNWNAILNTTVISNIELIYLTGMVVSCVVLRFIFQTVTFIDAAHGDSAKSGILQLITSIVSLILIYFITLFTPKGNLFILAIAVVIPPIIIFIIYSLIVFKNKYAIYKPTYSAVNKNSAKALIGLSLQFFVVSITATIIYASIPFIITQLFGPSKVTEFNIANSIFNMPIMLIGIVSMPVLPLVTQAYAKGDTVWLKATLKRLFYISILFSLGTIVLIFIANWVYHLWVGDKVAIPFDLTLTIGVYTIIMILNTPFSNFLNGMGKVRILTILAPVGVIVFIGFSIILAKWLDNLISVPIALSITSLIGLIVVPYTVLKNLNAK